MRRGLEPIVTGRRFVEADAHPSAKFSPATAVIGAFGTAGDTSYSDGSSAMNSWRLDAHPGSSSQADLTNFITFVSITALNFDAQAIRVIDSSGNTLGLRLAYFYEDGTTVDLST